MDWTAIISTLLGILGGGFLSQLFNHLQKKAKLPVEQYELLVARLEVRIEKLEKDHTQCMEDHSIAQRQIGELTGRMQELKEFMTRSARSAGEVAGVAAAQAAVGAVSQITGIAPGDSGKMQHPQLPSGDNIHR